MPVGAQLATTLRAHVAAKAPQVFTRLGIELAAREPPKRSGQLNRSRQLRSRITPTGFAVDVQYTAPQATFTNDGTRPHIILPRRKKALYWPGAAHPVRRVNHPGTKATKWFTKATHPSQWLAILQDVFG